MILHHQPNKEINLSEVVSREFRRGTGKYCDTCHLTRNVEYAQVTGDGRYIQVQYVPCCHVHFYEPVKEAKQ